MNFDYVIIGGGLAGGRACQGILKIDSDATIALITKEQHLPYQRPPLSKGYLTGKQGLDKVYLREADYYAEHHVQIITGVQATDLHPAEHLVQLSDGQTVHYGKLLLATGGRARRLQLPKSTLDNVFVLRTIDDSEAIQHAAQNAEHTLVLGGSFIGAEVAASLAQLDVPVTMVFPESRLLERIVPEELGHFLQQKYQDNGIDILSGTIPHSLHGEGAVASVTLDNGQSLETSLVVMGVGIELNTDLARQAGLAMWEQDAVQVDEMLRTSEPDIYAAGDIAAWPDPTFGRMRVEHWDVAWNQGMQAGRNMAGEATPYTVLPYFFSDLFDLSFEVWGNLAQWDQTVRRGEIAKNSFAFYYFDEGTLVGVLAIDRPDEERAPMQTLIKTGVSYQAALETLQDEQADLNTLIEEQ